jgi:hypothetical protein
MSNVDYSHLPPEIAKELEDGDALIASDRAVFQKILTTRLDDLAARASRHTGRTLRWSIKAGVFFLGDDTALGNLQLRLDGRKVSEVYMRTSHFGLTAIDLTNVTWALTPGIERAS